MGQNLGDIIDLRADFGTPALIDVRGPEASRTFSFEDIDSGANAIARGLLRRGFSRGDAIGILAPNSYEYLICYLGTMRAGLVSVPINTRVPAQTIEFICRDAQLSAVFADPTLRASCPARLPVFDIDERGVKRFEDIGPFDSVSPERAETALIIYTSGSSGTPKGVVLSHASQRAGVDAIDDAVRLGFRGQRALVAAPLFHVNGLGFCGTMLNVGGTIVLLPRFKADAFIEAIETHRVNIITGLPTMLARIAGEEELISQTDLSSVNLVFLGSAPLTETIVRQAERLFPGAVLINGYGTTETGGGIFGAHPDGLPRPQFSVGHPAAHVQVRLVDGPGAEWGVLEIKSATNMTGYKNLPDASAARMRSGWYHTGDVMRCDEDGFYFFVGRDDDMFVCAGENIHPSEVEQVLDRHPDITQVCVVPMDDPVRGQVPVAFVVSRDGAQLTEEDVKSFALANAPAYMHPRRVTLLDQMPLAGTNKVDRRALLQKLRTTDRSELPD